jgi:tryptophan synthase alpha chain
MNTVNQIIKKSEGDICSLFFTAGFPELGDTKEILLSLDRENVDFIEVGMPYSDPMADGPTIQYSSQVALQNGMNLDLLFDQLEEIKDQIRTPMVLMGYFNQFLTYGEDRFLKRANQCGIETLILPDLPMIEYEKKYKNLFAKYNVSNVFLITPQTSDKRIHKIDEMTEAFIYVVSSPSITGSSGGSIDVQQEYFKRIREMNLNNPQIIGFGISDRAGFQRANDALDGAIIGSAYIKALDKGGVQATSSFLSQLRS